MLLGDASALPAGRVVIALATSAPAAAFTRVLDALNARGCAVRGSGRRRNAQCPAHTDSKPSLSVTAEESRVLVHCHAGCDIVDVLAALNLTSADLLDEPCQRGQRNGAVGPLVVAEYEYIDKQGRLLFVVERRAPKAFRQRRPDGRGGWKWSLGGTRRVLYRLPAVLAAVAAGRTVYVVEGEKDVHAIEAAGAVATCNPGGAGKWRPEYGDVLCGAEVIIVADRDGPGRKHARAVYADLAGKAASVRIVEPATGKDTSDHLDAGYRLDELVTPSETAPAEPQSGGVLVTLADVTPEPVSWVWPGRLPAGKVVTLDGDPALGKSTLAITVAAHLSTGRAWPDGTVCPLGDVVILSAEDGISDTIRPRLDAAGGDPARVHCLTAIRTPNENGDPCDRPPTLADVATIRQVIEATQARLLVVDVLMAYLPGKVDSHRDQDVRAVLHRLAEVAEATGCTVLLLRHLNKSGAGTPMYRGGGSIGIVGAARAGYVVALDPDDETGRTRVLACIKANLAEQPPSLTYRLESAPASHVAHVVWGEASPHSAADLLHTTDPAEDRRERDDAGAFILDYLTDHGGIAPASEVMAAARKAGFGRSTVYRGADKVKVQKEKSGMTGPWYWRHPDDRNEGPTEGPEDPSS
ncbi:MAG TPA: AAA family ATPase [Pseudonocardiaceae bacterium]|nr:AAA family ATPase [Pseudonocardiaceae bacterium]